MGQAKYSNTKLDAKNPNTAPALELANGETTQNQM